MLVISLARQHELICAAMAEGKLAIQNGNSPFDAVLGNLHPGILEEECISQIAEGRQVQRVVLLSA